MEKTATKTKGEEPAQEHALIAEALRPGSTAQVMEFGTEAVVILRAATGLSGYFAGDLASFGIAEVFEHVRTGLRTGALVVSGRRSRRRVTFRDGQISFAISTAPHERLGAALLRQKLLTPAQLKEALLEVKPGTPLGQVVTRTGWVPAPAVYKAMGELVREIALELFTLDEGSFVFLEGVASKDSGIKLPQPLRELVLEGMKRESEVAGFRSKYPSSLCLVRGAAPKEPERKGLWDLAESEADVAALHAKFEGGEHLFYATLDALVRGRALEEKEHAASGPVSESDAAADAKVSDRYGSIIRSVCKALQARGRSLSDLRSFLGEPLPGMEGAFVGVTLSDEGALDVDRILQNMIKVDPARGRIRANEALNSFVSFVLFTTRTTLPEELLRQLMVDFTREPQATKK